MTCGIDFTQMAFAFRGIIHLSIFAEEGTTGCLRSAGTEASACPRNAMVSYWKAGDGVPGARLATQVRISFEAERRSNTLLGPKDVSTVLSSLEVIKSVI